MTIQDIARLAGVSKSTVSRVINDADNVNEKTRAHVLKVIEEYHFTPSAMAQAMPRQTTNVIGIIIPEPDNSFFGKILIGIENKLEEMHLNYNTIISHSRNNPHKELMALQMLNRQRVKGLLLTTSIEYTADEEYRKMKQTLENFNAPIVLMDRQISNSTLDGVYFDNYNGAYRATETLIQAKHRSIGAIISDQKLKLGRERYKGYMQALQDWGGHVEKGPLFTDDYPITSEQAYEITKEMIQENRLPDAIFLSNNLITDGFFKAIFKAGMVLGRDVCCIGMDHSSVSDILNINFSYVDKNPVWVGEVAVEMLADRIQKPAVSKREEVQHGNLLLNGSERKGNPPVCASP